MLLSLFIIVLLGSSYLKAQTAQDIVDDMTGPSQGCPHGAPGGWECKGSFLDKREGMPPKNFNNLYMRSFTAWGQAYIPVEGSPAVNTRCQIRNLDSQILTKDGKWHRAQFSSYPLGAAFYENFWNNNAIGANPRDESNNEGGISVIVGTKGYSGRNYHFWPEGNRGAIDTINIVGILTRCEARLIKDDSNGPDDRAICKNILSMGGDWWLDTSVGWLPDWSANFGIGSGRWKWVTSDWQSFNMCTIPTSQILANPPLSIKVFNIPEKIEAEDFAASKGIALNNTQDVGGGVSVGWNDPGDWLEYHINVPTEGNYIVNARVSSDPGGVVDILNGSNVLGTLTIPRTGSWETWTTVSKTIYLQAGNQTLRFLTKSGGANFNWMEFKNSGPTMPVTSVSVLPSSATVAAGSTTTLTVTILPANANNKTLNWTTSNASVAAVNANGVVTGMSAGTVTITATSADGSNKSGTSTITVPSIHVIGVTVSPATASVKAGATTQLTATIAPSNATNKTVSWSSSNTGIATVSSTGLVKGVSMGSVTFTVTTQDGNKTATSTGEIATEVKPVESYLQLKVYPNPLNDGVLNIRIDGQTGNASLNIFTLDGSKKYSGILMKGETKLINNLATGTYLIKVSGNNINEVRKIVIM